MALMEIMELMRVLTMPATAAATRLNCGTVMNS